MSWLLCFPKVVDLTFKFDMISLVCIGVVLLNVAAESTNERTKSRTANQTGEEEERRGN